MLLVVDPCVVVTNIVEHYCMLSWYWNTSTGFETVLRLHAIYIPFFQGRKVKTLNTVAVTVYCIYWFWIAFIVKYHNARTQTHTHTHSHTLTRHHSLNHTLHQTTSLCQAAVTYRSDRTVLLQVWHRNGLSRCCGVLKTSAVLTCNLRVGR